MEQWKDLGFQPMVDKRFFPEHPYDTVDYKDFAGPQREILMGTNANEGALFLSMGRFAAETLATFQFKNRSKLY